MQKKTRHVLLGFVILSLLLTGGIVTTGFLKYKSENKETPVQGKNNVLGDETTALITTAPQAADNVNRLIQNSLQETRDVVSQKVIEMEKTIINTINKEIGNMTQTQVDNLKWQICRDLGVVSASPTP